MRQSGREKKQIAFTEIGNVIPDIKLPVTFQNCNEFKLIMQMKPGSKPGLNKFLEMEQALLVYNKFLIRYLHNINIIPHPIRE
jgi:hypothetical protein